MTQKLEEARKLYQTANADQKYVLESLFPELKESEGERIRKAIHIYLDWLDGRKDYAPKGEYSIKDMIVWLNKQGVQKPTENEELTKFDKAVGVSIGTWNPKTPEQIKSVKAVSKKLLELAKKQINDEQKPAWSEEDESIALGVEQLCNCASLLNIAPDKIDKIRAWLKSLRPQNRWKPNDEQMDALKGVQEGVFRLNILESLYNDLKKL